MRLLKLVPLAGMLLVSLGSIGCHYDRDTAGRPGPENNETPGSVVATKEGTGDPKVGSGRGQVGTDAPARENPDPHGQIPAK